LWHASTSRRIRSQVPKEFWAKTLKEANAKRDAFRDEHKRNPNADRVTTFGAFLEADFIPYEEARYQAGELTWTRFQARRSRLQRYVLGKATGKGLVAAPLAKLSPQIVERYFEDLLKAGVGPGLRNAIRRDLILALRKTRRALSYPSSEFFLDIPTAREEQKIKLEFDADDVLDRIEDDALAIEARAIVAFIFMLNCRPNEMFALRWSDIDWRSESVTIRRAVRVDRGGYTERDTTKTGRRGDRALPLGPVLADLLRRVKKTRMAQQNVSDFVFCEANGARFCKDSFRYAWRRVRAVLKLPDGPTFYSLKTTGNSYALANGVSTAAQAKKMGHTTTRMADNVYRTLQRREIVAAVEVYDRKRSSATG